MGMLVVLTLALWCFAGVFSQEGIKLDCSRYQPSAAGNFVRCPRLLKQVCGTDGNTYANECELCKVNLQKVTDDLVDLKYPGKCIKLDCSRYQASLDRSFIPCPRNLKQVCGTDGTTYDNECLLCDANFRRKAEEMVDVSYPGKCVELPDISDKGKELEPLPVHELDCSRYQISATGTFIPCPRLLNPICGTDDITYANECELCNSKVQRKTDEIVKMKHPGQCIKDYCRDYSPDQVMCPLNYSPICGSDGQTYGNMCRFCTTALNKENLFLQAAQSCQDVNNKP